jgi:hypothetical protein
MSIVFIINSCTLSDRVKGVSMLLKEKKTEGYIILDVAN